MKNIQKYSAKLSEVMLWVAIALTTASAFFGTYYYNFSAPIKALIWIGWFVLTLFFGFFTKQGKQVYVFGTEAKLELHKVVWPSRQETIQTTSIVMVMVAVTGFVLWGIDSSMLWAIGKITHLG
jgi:preprotein translocase subunit SecE